MIALIFGTQFSRDYRAPFTYSRVFVIRLAPQTGIRRQGSIPSLDGMVTRFQTCINIADKLSSNSVY
jgi:hypothetical protein